MPGAATRLTTTRVLSENYSGFDSTPNASGGRAVCLGDLSGRCCGRTAVAASSPDPSLSGLPRKSNLRPLLILAVSAAALMSTSCTTEQAYSVGQEFRRNEYAKILDAQEHQRCMSNTGTSYEAYRREVDMAKESK